MRVIDREFFNLAVLNAPLAQVVHAFATLPKPFLSRSIPLIFPDQPHNAKEDDLPLILWSPLCAPNLTAFMPHVSSGDYFVASYASEKFGFSLVEVRSTSPERTTDHINEFATYEGKGAKPRRFIRAMSDNPKWDFFTTGEPLAFENLSAYKARRIRDRITREILLSYMEHWGAPVKSPDFWRSNESTMTLLWPSAMTTPSGIVPSPNGFAVGQ
jgi:hypothetical protein